MFDFAWSEIMLIGVVALIAIGPKDMPAAIKAIAQVVKKARRMAAEFQTHVDELMREADLHEVREQINEIRNFDIRGEAERTIDPDGSLRATFASNPLEPLPNAAAPAASPEPAAPALAEHGAAVHDTDVMERPAKPDATEPAPAFVPPEAAAPQPVTPEPQEPPAFIPPGVERA